MATVEVDRSRDEEALRRFEHALPEIEHELGHWTQDFNIFDVLGATHNELRHSRMLEWLMDPRTTHGLGDAFLRELLNLAGAPEEVLSRPVPLDARIIREQDHIDIVAEVRGNPRVVLAIENKVWSAEHDDQLSRYERALERRYRNSTLLYLFLTPDGRETLENESWRAVAYSGLLEALSRARRGKTLTPRAEEFIDDYDRAVRRGIVGDRKLENLCRAIYAEHKDALDVLIENLPNPVTEADEVLNEFLGDVDNVYIPEGLVTSRSRGGSRRTIRFMTRGLDEAIKEPGGKGGHGWGTHGGHRCYEVFIVTGDAELTIRFQVTFFLPGTDDDWRQTVRAFLAGFGDDDTDDFNNMTVPGGGDDHLGYSSQRIHFPLDDGWETNIGSVFENEWDDFARREVNALRALRQAGL